MKAIINNTISCEIDDDLIITDNKVCEQSEFHEDPNSKYYATTFTALLQHFGNINVKVLK